jgi:hypothetical protein
MRIFLAAVSLVALVACGEQKPAPVAEVTPAVAAPAPVVEPSPEARITKPEAVPALIAGKWVSIDDAKSSITLTADGKWTDNYEGEGDANDDAAWRAISGVEAKAASPTDEFTPEATYLEVKRADGAFYYELGDLDAENLDMFYVGRGNRLAYTRAK